MAGNKNSGRGRKSNFEENFRLKTIDKAWLLLDKHLDDETLDLKFRLDLAKSLAVKSIPTELSGGITANLVQMGSIEKRDQSGTLLETLEFNIGTKADTPEDP